MKKFFVVFLLCLLSSFSSAQTNTNAVIEGVRVPSSVQLAGRKLQLNGAGVRYKAVVKVYVAALYLEQPSINPEQIYNTKGSMQLALTMLRNINSAELGRLFIKGMEENCTKEEQTRLISDFRYMGELFARFKNLEKGETKTINFTLTDKELGFYDNDGKYLVEPGTFKIMVGGSSDKGLESGFEIKE